MATHTHTLAHTGPPPGGAPGANMPGEDVHENSNAQAPQPNAPDPSKMDHVSGYDNVGFGAAAGKIVVKLLREESSASLLGSFL